LNNVVDWLLEEENPSVRYFALRDLIRLPDDSPELMEAKTRINSSREVQKILHNQSEGGWWGHLEEFYTNNKYRGTVWNLILLAELGANIGENRILKAIDCVLDVSQDVSIGGFAYRKPDPSRPDSASIIPCLTGNMTWAMLRMGYPLTGKLESAVDWMVRIPRFIDGDSPAPVGEEYKHRQNCWGKHTCISGIVKILKALAEIPEEERTLQINKVIQDISEFLLKHHLYKKSHNLTEVSKKRWPLLGFPWLWDTDVLEMLDILTRLKIKDPRLEDAINLVKSKQMENGRWIQEWGFRDQLRVPFEKVGSPSKWITLFAMRVLQRVSV
jgi:hypothetical protein